MSNLDGAGGEDGLNAGRVIKEVRPRTFDVGRGGAE